MLLKDYSMNLLYHSGMTNGVVDALSKLSMGSVNHIEKKKEMDKDMHRLARLGVCLCDTDDGGLMV